MTNVHRLVNAVIKQIVRILCRVDDSQWEKFPREGPVILAGNHISFLEVPVLITHLLPRPITMVTKKKNKRNRFFEFFMIGLWESVPLNEERGDRHILKELLRVLEAGRILAILPEGTRSRNGQLQEGRQGIVLLAQRSGVPILPVVYYGHEHFWENLLRLRRTDFNLVLGNPFRLDRNGQVSARLVREQMAAEIMYQLAALLPPSYRGLYSDLENASSEYLVFEEGVENNLERARRGESQ